MEKKLANCESIDVLAGVKFCGSKVCILIKNVADHPLTKPALIGAMIYFFGSNVMKNEYDATLKWGSVGLSLTKRK